MVADGVMHSSCNSPLFYGGKQPNAPPVGSCLHRLAPKSIADEYTLVCLTPNKKAQNYASPLAISREPTATLPPRASVCPSSHSGPRPKVAQSKRTTHLQGALFVTPLRPPLQTRWSQSPATTINSRLPAGPNASAELRSPGLGRWQLIQVFASG